MPFFLLAGFAIFCLVFLAVGAFVFVVSLAGRRMRQYALSAALWCAVWGPCLIAWMLFAAMVGFVVDYRLEHLAHGPIRPAVWRSGFGIGLGLLALLSTAAVATVAAWLHQALIRRMTFALFRVYAMLVSAGIGSVWAWSLGLGMAAYGVPYRLPVWLAAMLVFTPGFGYLGFRSARQLRGKPPERFTWVTPEEFDGTPLTPKNFAN